MMCIDWRLLQKQVLLHHQGDMLFKGVNQGMAIYQLTMLLSTIREQQCMMC